MGLIYITGPTGAGKSTVRQRLAALGHVTYDVDDAEMRVPIQPMDKNSKPLLTVPAETIRKLKHQAADKDIYLCGTLPTDSEYADDFDMLFVLTLGGVEQERRIKQRTNSAYGKRPEQLATALGWRDRQIEKYVGLGAIPIDATQPVEVIVQDILSRTVRSR